MVGDDNGLTVDVLRCAGNQILQGLELALRFLDIILVIYRRFAKAAIMCSVIILEEKSRRIIL